MEKIIGEAIGKETLNGEAVCLETLLGECVNEEAIDGGDLMQIQNLSLPRGDSRTYRLTITDEEDNIYNLTGATVYFTVKEANSQADSVAVIQLSSASITEIDIDEPTNGKAYIYVKNIHTQDMEIKSFIYDCQVLLPTNDVNTVLSGRFTITEDVSRTV